MIISLDAEKAFDKNPTTLLDKVLERLGKPWTYLTITKAIYRKPITNIKLNGEKIKVIPLKWGTRQSCPLFPSLLNIGFELLAKARRQLKEIQNGKKSKVPSLTDDMIVYISDPQYSTRELLRTLSIKWLDTRLTQKTQYPSYTQMTEELRKESKKHHPSQELK